MPPIDFTKDEKAIPANPRLASMARRTAGDLPEQEPTQAFAPDVATVPSPEETPHEIVPVVHEVQVTEDSTPAKMKKPGRGKKKAEGLPKRMATVYLSEENVVQIAILKATTRVSNSDFIDNLCTRFFKDSYKCSSPACGVVLTIQGEGMGTGKPCNCPVCGSKLRQSKNG